jgi:hypothetical protein
MSPPVFLYILSILNEVNVNSNGHKIHVIRKVASEGMEELMKLLSEKEKA